MTSPAPLSPGVCTVWTTAAAVTAMRPDVAALMIGGTPPSTDRVIPVEGLAQAVADATDLLFALSGRQFPGICSTTIRPTARPRSWTLAEWSNYWSALTGNGFSASWGVSNGGMDSAVWDPPQIDLGVYPIQSIDEVRIDGIVIPPNEYRVDDNRLLVRVRPTPEAEPTDVYGWPVQQDWSLPDGQPGTFAVDVSYGAAPPSSGVSAAIALAVELVKGRYGAKNRLPARLTSVNRQGVSFAVLDPMTFLDNGLTGLYDVDLFIRAFNPGRATARPMMWSPETAKIRRPTLGGP